MKLYEVREVKDLRDMLDQSTTLFGDNTAFLVRREINQKPIIKTYLDVRQEVDYFGTALYKAGLSQKHIAIMGENRYEWCISYLATVCGNSVVVPIDKDLPEDDLVNVLTTSESDALIFSNKYKKLVENIIPRLNPNLLLIDMDGASDNGKYLSWNSFMLSGKEAFKQGEIEYKNAVIDAEKMSILLFTSGTTGMAKGVMLSHKNICSNITSVRKTVYILPSDRFLSILPLHHTYECSLGLLCVLYSGATIAFCDGLKYIAKNMQEYQPSSIMSVPLLLENIHKKIFAKARESRGGIAKIKFGQIICKAAQFFGISIHRKIFAPIYENLGGNLRLIITGASAIDPKVSKDFRSFGISVLQGYGLTECSPLVAGNRDKYIYDDSVGLPLPGVEMKLIHKNELGIGEIAVKGLNVMLGYYKDTAATAKVFEDGWFLTGDLGTIDQKGVCRLTGRLKNVIVTKNGKNIIPEELESFLYKSGLIAESVVWGDEDEKSKETFVRASLLPNMDAIKEKLKMTQITKEDVYRTMRELVKDINKKLPQYKFIQKFDIRESEFIKTTTHKIKRHMVKGVTS